MLRAKPLLLCRTQAREQCSYEQLTDKESLLSQMSCIQCMSLYAKQCQLCVGHEVSQMQVHSRGGIDAGYQLYLPPLLIQKAFIPRRELMDVMRFALSMRGT